MKKNKLLLLALTVLPVLIGCSSTGVYTPSHSYPGAASKANPGSNQSNSGGQGGQEEEREENMTVNFFIDYSHSDTPIYSMRWYMLEPLEKCPEQAVLTDADAKDPLYGKFLGYSEYSSAVDESLLWNFETDFKQGNVLNLYGIWVSK